MYKHILVVLLVLALCGSAFAQTPAFFLKWLEANDLIYNKECDSFAIITGIIDSDRDTLLITPDVFMRGSDAGWDTVSMLGPKIDSMEIVDDAVATGHILNGTILGEDMGQDGASSGQQWTWSGTEWGPGDDLTGTGFWTGPGNYVILSSIDDSVGMGTATPTTKLEVVGETKTDTLIVDEVLSIGGDDIDELVGTGLQESDGDLQTTLGTSVDLTSEVTGELPDGNVSNALTVTGYMEDEDVNTFAELQSWVSDKTLVNEEDIFTIDANWVNTANPWADNEVDDGISVDEASDVDTTGTKIEAALDNARDSALAGIRDTIPILEINADTIKGIPVTAEAPIAGDVLKRHADSGAKWVCMPDETGAGGAGLVVEEDGGTEVASTDTMNFLAPFDITSTSALAIVNLDTDWLNANWKIATAVLADTAATSADENVEDKAAAMIIGGVQTQITVTYDDVNAEIDFVLDDPVDSAVAAERAWKDSAGSVIGETYFYRDGRKAATGNWSLNDNDITSIDSIHAAWIWGQDSIHTPGGMYASIVWGVTFVNTSHVFTPEIRSYPSGGVLTFDDSVTMDGNPLFGLPVVQDGDSSLAASIYSVRVEIGDSATVIRAAVSDTSLILSEVSGGSDKIYWDNDTVEIVDDGGDTLRIYHDGTSWVLDGGEGLTVMDSALVDTLLYVVSPGQTDTTFITNVFLDSVRAGSFGGGNGGTSVEILESNVSKDDPLVILNLMAGFAISVANDTTYVTLDLTEDQVDLTAEVTGTLPVNKGGTGAASHTDHAILIGSGTGAFSHPGVMINGQVLIGVTGADPVAATISEGEAIDVSEGAGTITISAEDAASDNKGVVTLATIRAFGDTAAGDSIALALRLTGGEMSGNITMAGSETVDGVDVSELQTDFTTDSTKLDGVESGADVTDATNVNAAGAVMETDFEATTFMYATSDDTPQPKTPAEVKAILDLEIGTDVLAEQTIGIADDNLLEVDGSPNSGEYARFTANGLEGRTEGEFKADYSLEIGTDVLAEQTIGIADNNLVEMEDADAADNDYAKFTANGLEGRSYGELADDVEASIDHGNVAGLGDDDHTQYLKESDTAAFALTVLDAPTIATSLTMGSASLSEAELEILDDATVSTTEMNYVVGVTSAIQTQLDAKMDTDSAIIPLMVVGGKMDGLEDSIILWPPGSYDSSGEKIITFLWRDSCAQSGDHNRDTVMLMALLDQDANIGDTCVALYFDYYGNNADTSDVQIYGYQIIVGGSVLKTVEKDLGLSTNRTWNDTSLIVDEEGFTHGRTVFVMFDVKLKQYRRMMSSYAYLVIK